MKKNVLVISLFTFSFSLSTFLCKAQVGFTFDSLSSGMTSPGAYVLSLAMKDSSEYSPLYAGGHFKIAGRDTCINIAEWIDSSQIGNYNYKKWNPLGSGTNGDVCALAMLNSYLYAGGKFDTAGGIATSHIARWDTASQVWDSLIGQLNGNVYALCVYNNALYVGGDFTIADGDTVNRIAVWNDSLWAPVGKGFDTGAVYAFAVSNDTLYAGGSFLKSNGIVVNHIAKLNGNNWDSVRGGTNNTVYALADYDGLYVGGAFTQSGGIKTRYISVYDDYFSYQWDYLGSGVNDTVRVLNAGVVLYASTVKKKQIEQGFGGGGVLLVGGNFDSAGGYSSHYIAAYMGTWDTIGTLNGPVYALANPYAGYQYADANYVGGQFSVANNGYYHFSDTLNNIATIGLFIGGGIQSLSENSNVLVYPNPSGGAFTLQVKSEELKVKNIEVYNILGEKVYSNYSLSANHYLLDLSSNPNGIYLYRITDTNGNLIGTGKLIINK